MPRRLTAVAALACLGAFLLSDVPVLPGVASVEADVAPVVAEQAAGARAEQQPADELDALLAARDTPDVTPEQARRIARRVRPEPSPDEVVRDPREPATAREWGALFHSLPTDEWGGGDVSVSVRLASGRRLWMYGDTLSRRNVFVHSSAIVTDARSIEVANGGQQILPVEPVVDGRRTVYWTETLTPLEGEYVLVTTTPVSLNVRSLGSWDFHRVDARSRQGLLHVDAVGDVHFLGWVGWVPRPDIGTDSEDFASPRPGHYTYGAFVHAIRLRNGSFLRTRNNNYAGLDRRIPDGSPRYEMWRPSFEVSPTRVEPYWGR